MATSVPDPVAQRAAERAAKRAAYAAEKQAATPGMTPNQAARWAANRMRHEDHDRHQARKAVARARLAARAVEDEDRGHSH